MPRKSVYLSLQMRSNVRNYYKPKQKDAFFDVEGVVNKDTLLFRNEFHDYIRLLPIFSTVPQGYVISKILWLW